MKILVTGAAGFIGAHTVSRLLRDGREVTGLDNLNSYYQPELKRARLDWLRGQGSFSFHEADLGERDRMDALFKAEGITHIVHLAAQAGVRYSLTHPHSYAASNLEGFLNILELARHHKVAHLLYASSSSVYGLNTTPVFRTADHVNHPISLYAATKKANELMAHSYSHLYRIPSTGMRFFTVYGPWGRPDMAYYKFTRAIMRGEPIQLFNNGRMQRDFTYIDDVVEAVTRLIGLPAQPNPDWDGADPDPASSSAPYRIYNIGNHHPVPLLEFVNILETAIGKKAVIENLPMQPGDVPSTSAETGPLTKATGFEPDTPLTRGLGEFVRWYRDTGHRFD